MKLQELFQTISTEYPVLLEIRETDEILGLEVDEDYIDSFDKTEYTFQSHFKDLKILKNFDDYNEMTVTCISVSPIVNTDKTVTPTMFITVSRT